MIPSSTRRLSQWAMLASHTVDRVISRLKVCWLMSANANKPTFGMHPSMLEGYVKRFYPESMKPVLDRGYTHTMTHLHNGDDARWENGAPMNGDARNEAVARGFTAVLDFPDMLDLMAIDYPRVVHLAYIGSPWDPDFGARLRKGQYSNFTDYWRRAILDIHDKKNCDIGIDHSATVRRGYEIENGGNVKGFPSLAWKIIWQWIEYVKACKEHQGRRVWLEAMPHRDAPYMHHYDFICVDKVNTLTPYETTRPPDDQLFEGAPHSTWATPTQMLTGRTLRCNWVLGPHDLRIETWAAEAADVLKDGLQFDFASGFQYLKVPASKLAEAIIAHAHRQVEALTTAAAATDPDNTSPAGNDDGDDGDVA